MLTGRNISAKFGRAFEVSQSPINTSCASTWFPRASTYRWRTIGSSHGNNNKRFDREREETSIYISLEKKKKLTRRSNNYHTTLKSKKKKKSNQRDSPANVIGVSHLVLCAHPLCIRIASKYTIYIDLTDPHLGFRRCGPIYRRLFRINAEFQGVHADTGTYSRVTAVPS